MQVNSDAQKSRVPSTSGVVRMSIAPKTTKRRHKSSASITEDVSTKTTTSVTRLERPKHFPNDFTVLKPLQPKVERSATNTKPKILPRFGSLTHVQQNYDSTLKIVAPRVPSPVVVPDALTDALVENHKGVLALNQRVEVLKQNLQSITDVLRRMESEDCIRLFDTSEIRSVQEGMMRAKNEVIKASVIAAKATESMKAQVDLYRVKIIGFQQVADARECVLNEPVFAKAFDIDPDIATAFVQRQHAILQVTQSARESIIS
jgi:hypothetical protein